MSEITQSKTAKTVDFFGLQLIRLGKNTLYLKFLKPVIIR